jgi:hypothetical protein
MIQSVIKFDPQGTVHCLYTEAVDLSSIGPLQIARASNIEFNQASQLWEVRVPEGQLLFSNPSRGICLAWEHQYFNR